MMTATAALERGHGHATTQDQGRRHARLDGGRTKIDNADRKGMGWITFEDGIAYSRNVVAAKVALGLGRRPPKRRASSTTCGASWVRRQTGIDVAGRSAARQRPGASSRGARSTSRTARSARAWPSRRSSSRPRTRRSSTADAGRAARRPGDRRPATSRPAPGKRVVDAGCRQAARPDLMDHVVDDGPVLPRPDARPGLLRRRQDRHGPDLGRQGERRPRGLEAQPVQLLVRRLHRPREGRPRPRGRRPHRGGHADRRPGRAAGDAGHVLRAVPSHRHRRHHHARPADRSRPTATPADPDR